jgi:hypothetical protein
VLVIAITKGVKNVACDAIIRSAALNEFYWSATPKIENDQCRRACIFLTVMNHAILGINLF